MIIYRGLYTDLEVEEQPDGTQANIQATKRIDIIDLESNPFNIAVTSEVVGPNIVFTFTFDELPAAATGTAIGYSSDGGINWSSSTGGVTSPRTLTVPFASYLLTFTIHLPAGNIVYSLEDTIVELELTDDPCRDIVIDNAEDKFTTIRARQLAIQIFSGNGISIDTFSEGGDNRFATKHYINDVLHFTGFLSMGDESQQILPDPNIIQLIAVDGLGFLSEIPLTDFNGNNPENENSILDYLLWALKDTGLELNLRAMFNIREVTASNLEDDEDGLGHIFKFNSLDAKTFEDQINTCINAYDVIDRILGKEAFLFQWLGEWRIVRIDEMEFGRDGIYYCWDWQRLFVEKTTETNEQSVGVDEEHSWMNDDAERSNQRLIKKLELNYKYLLPLETPCNKDFERGEILTDSPTVKTYDLDCWQKLWSNTTTDDQQFSGIYIRREFINDYEVERYVVLEQNANLTFIKSSRIFCGARDKFIIDISRRLGADIGGSGFYRDNAVQVRLYGNNGTFWTHHGQNSADPSMYWEQCTSTFRTNQHFYNIEGDASNDLTEAKNLYNGETAEIPVAGYIQILIFRSSNFGDTEDTYIDSLTFDYLAFVNGSYRKYTGQQHSVTQEARTSNVLKDDKFIDNSPSRQYKGALLVQSGTSLLFSGSAIFNAGNSVQIPGDFYSAIIPGMRIIIAGSVSNNITAKITSVSFSIIASATIIEFDTETVAETPAAITISVINYDLAGLFYNAATEPSGPENPKQYGEIQAFDVWNQNNRTIKKFAGTVDHSNPPPGMLNKYFMTDFWTTRMFLLLHYEYDTHQCEWEAFFMEVSSSVIFKSYTGHGFKYLTNE